MKNLSIITEEGGADFPWRSEVAGSSIGDDDEPPDIDRGCRCCRPSLAQSGRERPDIAKDEECRLRTRTVRRRLLLVEGHRPPAQPFKKSLTTEKTTNAAWRTKPTLYAVSTQDRTINPDLERFMAKRMGAKTIEIEASHLALISHPDAITDLILQALAVWVHLFGHNWGAD
jgi:Alpha/beta hydrolase family